MTLPLRTLALRALAVAAAILLAVVGLAPAATGAARPVVTVDEISAHEGEWVCTASPPYSCAVQPGRAYLQIRISPSQRTAVTLGWQLEPITATAGSDYGGPLSGTATIPARGYVTSVNVPLVIDGVAEPTESFRLRITSSSVPANISDVGVATILDATQIPADCTVSQTAYNNMFMDCTNRPAGQRWQLQGFFANIGGGDTAYGNVVTGNGRSSIPAGPGYGYYPHFRVVP